MCIYTYIYIFTQLWQWKRVKNPRGKTIRLPCIYIYMFIILTKYIRIKNILNSPGRHNNNEIVLKIRISTHSRYKHRPFLSYMQVVGSFK